MKKVLTVLMVLTMVLVLGGQLFAAAQAETGKPKVAGSRLPGRPVHEIAAVGLS